jgi:hypothetical protein
MTVTSWLTSCYTRAAVRTPIDGGIDNDEGFCKFLLFCLSSISSGIAPNPQHLSLAKVTAIYVLVNIMARRRMDGSMLEGGTSIQLLGYRLDDRGTVVRFPGTSDFDLLRIFLFSGHQKLIPLVKASRGVRLTTHLYLLPLKNVWGRASSPPHAFLAWCLIEPKGNFA